MSGVLWAALVIVASALQTARFVLQKVLSGSGLSVGGATFSRFLFGAPIALAAATALLLGTSEALPDLTPRFWGFMLAGGAAQIFRHVSHGRCSSCAISPWSRRLYQDRNVSGRAVFGADPGRAGGTPGLAGDHDRLWRRDVDVAPARGGRMLSRPMVYGLLAGAGFAVAAIGYRGATVELEPLPFLIRAMVALAAATSSQTLGMALYLRVFEPGELSRVVAAWRRTIWVGVTGVGGSAGWFAAFALQNAAYVRAFGQIEMVFTLLASVWFFGERLHRREGAGIALVVASLVALVLAGRG
ncbi:MAG: EamA/RhaT family transporter [Paracoccaceae bacterium]